MQPLYPKVSILHYQDSSSKWQFMVVLAGKEQEKLLGLFLDGYENAYVVFENCYYLGKIK